MGFHTGYGPGKLLTSAVVKVDWDLSLPPTGQCSGMNGSSVFSQRSLFRGSLGGGISAGACLFHSKGRGMLEVGVRPNLEARRGCWCGDCSGLCADWWLSEAAEELGE